MVSGTKAHAEALLDEVAVVLSTIGLRLAPGKTVITHIDEGLDFLGWRIQRHHKRGTSKRYVYTYPARRRLRAGHLTRVGGVSGVTLQSRREARSMALRP
jgi:RNA-directed DNA polymerase